MSEILKPTTENIEKCASLLEREQILAIPTETVYGLSGLAMSDEAISKIYSVKNRPQFNPLISHYASINELSKDVILNDLALKLYESFCPGPITFVLNKSKNSRISRLASAGLDTAAVRFPAHAVTKELLLKIAKPLVAPSANPSGRISPVTAQQVSEMFGNKVSYVLDGGQCEVGIESTIIDLSSDQPILLRHGIITKEMIENVLGVPIELNSSDEIKAPGMMLKHYAPKCKLRLSTSSPRENEALLTFGSAKYEEGFSVVKNLSPIGDLSEAAKNLFNYLHELDSMNLSGIATTLLPEEGIGIAINDRLRRAAVTTDQ